VADQWSLPELVRNFIDFREETRDELKWLRRLLVGALASAVLVVLFR
jgi:hypothetical protein